MTIEDILRTSVLIVEDADENYNCLNCPLVDRTVKLGHAGLRRHVQKHREKRHVLHPRTIAELERTAKSRLT